MFNPSILADLSKDQRYDFRTMLSGDSNEFTFNGVQFTHVNYSKEYEDEYWTTQGVFKVDGELWAINGAYSSYEGNEWDDYTTAYRVKETEVSITVYAPIS
jgi:hypothetical protein